MRNIRRSIWGLGIASLCAHCVGCSSDDTTAPPNSDPIITAVRFFPAQVTPADSFAVFCTAHEPDGDALLYDWSCTSGRIQGSNGLQPLHLNNTTENVRVFYTSDDPNGPTSIRVDVVARDGRGCSASAFLMVDVTR
ncbi:MAG: hypothetical protein IPK64_10985 [bacterium]|nr:hypothetical protein [bacterium]